MPITHSKVSGVADNVAAPGLVQPSEWNAAHVIGALGAISATSINFGGSTLAAYQEGTWTPTLSLSTPGDLSVVYTGYRVGTYRKIGSQVTCWLRVETSTWTHSTAGGWLTVAGLPFTALDVGIQYVGVMLMQGWTLAGIQGMSLVALGGSTLLIPHYSMSGNVINVIPASALPSGGTVDLRGAISYVA